MNVIAIIVIVIIVGLILFLIKKEKSTNTDKEEDLVPIIPPEEVEEEEEVEDIEKPEPTTEPKVYYIELSEDENIDQTISLREQIAKIPDGTIDNPNIISIKKGTYWTEGDLENNPKGVIPVLELRDRHNLVIEGNDAVFYTKAPATPYGGNVTKGDYSRRRHIKFVFCSNIATYNLHLKGSNSIKGSIIGTTPELTPSFWKGGKDNGSIADSPAYKSYWEQEHGFEYYSSENMLLENCSVEDVWGDGVYVAGDRNKPSKDIVLKNLYLKYTGRQGVAASHVDGMLIDNVFIDRGRRAHLDFEPHKPELYVRNVEIRNCRLHAVGVVIAALGRGDVSDIYFHDNEYSRGATVRCWDSSKQQTRKNWRIENNTRIGNYTSKVSDYGFGKTNNITISGNNNSIDSTEKNVITFDNCKGELKVKGNNFNKGKYILVMDTKNVDLSNNTPELVTYEYGEKPE